MQPSPFPPSCCCRLRPSKTNTLLLSSYDAIFIGSLAGAFELAPFPTVEFIREAWGHGKAIGAFGNGSQILGMAGYTADSALGIYQGDAAAVTTQVLDALSGPVRFPQRFPVDSPTICQ